MIGDVEVMIDEWPFLEPFIEIEGGSEYDVRGVAERLGFTYSEAVFGAVDIVYIRKYSYLTSDIINNKIPCIVFGEKNPFLKV